VSGSSSERRTRATSQPNTGTIASITTKTAVARYLMLAAPLPAASASRTGRIR